MRLAGFQVCSWRRVVFCGLLTLLLFGQAHAQTIYVDDDTCPAVGSGTSNNPYCKIQTAICSIRDTGGGTVEVRPGSYNESLRMFPGVSVVSTAGPQVTTIDATGKPCITSACDDSLVDLSCSAVVFGSGFTSADLLDGFRITGGRGLFRDYGAGRDDAVAGGGVFVFNSSPTITRNEIVGNTLVGSTSKRFGAGIYMTGATYYVPAQPVITYNLIQDNQIPTPGPGVYEASQSLGGGIYIGLYNSPTIEGNTITGNTANAADASNGGGIVVYSLVPSPPPVISRNTISNNRSFGFGGGIAFSQVVYYSYTISAYVTAPTFGTAESNLIEFNQADTGGGISGGTTQARLINNTVVDNLAGFGGGFALIETDNVSDQVTAANNIIAFNAGDEVGGLGVGFSDPTLANNDIFGNTPQNVGSDGIIGSNGNLSLDPLFVDRTPGSRNLQLQSISPVVDGGINLFVGTNVDLNNEPRIVNGTVDLGAYERSGSADTDGDGIDDSLDNCPQDFNPGQEDGDLDNVGDACDNCPGDPINDIDGDGFCATADNCPLNTNPSQTDLDGDGLGDLCDDDDDGDSVDDLADCAPGASGISSGPGPVAELRLDAVGTGSRLVWKNGTQGPTSNVYRGGFTTTSGWVYNETCLLAQTPRADHVDASLPGPGTVLYYLIAAENVCGESRLGVNDQGLEYFSTLPCAALGSDSDGDGTPDLADNCPLDFNVGGPDTDRDFVGDVCDVCPQVSDPNQEDHDRDSIGDVCDSCTDRDGDGSGDPGFAANTCGGDNCPTVANPTQADADLDQLGDACDACPNGVGGDSDGDGVCDGDDAAPANRAICSDAEGDGCEDCASGSFDPNSDGADLDQDGLCDLGDPDDDNDGVDDLSDCAPSDPTLSLAAGTVGGSLRLAQSAGVTTLVWARGAESTTSNVYRGGFLAGSPFVYNESCFVSDTDQTFAADSDGIPVGALIYYQVSAVNSCGESSIGIVEAGTERLPVAACPSN